MKTPRLDKAIAHLDRKARFWGALKRERPVTPLPGLTADDMPPRKYLQRFKDSDGVHWHLHEVLLTEVLMDMLEQSPDGLSELSYAGGRVMASYWHVARKLHSAGGSAGGASCVAVALG